nr:centrosomal protein of 41 kDa isoform X5 [Globicephala melas]
MGRLREYLYSILFSQCYSFSSMKSIAKILLLFLGNSMTKYIEKLEEIKKNYRYKKDELFKRLKVTTFAQLVIQVASLSDQTLEVTAEEIKRLEDNDSATSDPDAEITAKTNGKGSPGEQSPSPVQFINSEGAGDSSRSTLQRIVQMKEPKSVQCVTSAVLDMVILVHRRKGYQLVWFPRQEKVLNPLKRGHPMLLELREKNAHGKIIILYDDDERLASQAATTMCERGFENLFMLSGGLKVLAQKFPEGLITGSLPASCQQTLPPASARKRSGPKVPPPAAENKWRYTPEDLKKIEYYLEEDQGPADSTSRLSQGNASGRDSKVPGSRSGQNLPAGAPAGHQNPRSLGSGHLQGKPWKRRFSSPA